MTPLLQRPFDVAIVMPTIVRPSLTQAVQSIYAQQFGGRVQILLGIDRWAGERAVLQQLAAECPSHMALTVLDLGYSTSQRHGGLYPSSFGGALRTILTYAANSRYVAYLDDDNYLGPQHLATMHQAAHRRTWAFSLRTLVDDATGDVLCVDRWESVGPDRGVYRASQGGFVDANCYLIDKLACHDVFTEWAMTRYAGGTGGDRQVFAKLRERPHGATGAASVFYRVRLDRQHTYMLWQMKLAGVDLARYMAPQALPSDAVWAQCAAFDRGETTAPTPGVTAPQQP